MINLSIEIIDLVSGSARFATGEETRLPPAGLALRRDRLLEHVPEDSIVRLLLFALP